MKVALCFLISYEHRLNKEEIWREWIEPNKDIIEVYVHYKEKEKISSEWLRSKAIPQDKTVPTDYLHVVPAYYTFIKYGLEQEDIQWFCFLTEACVPIISPLRFRELFFEKYATSLMGWKKAWWNVWYFKNRRANLHLLDPQMHLGNTPWFILSRSDATACIEFSRKYKTTFQTICNGEIANESVFAVALFSTYKLQNVLNVETMATDWSRMMTPNSPYLFTVGDAKDRDFIDTFIKTHPYTMFLRKVAPTFPDAILREYSKEKKSESL